MMDPTMIPASWPPVKPVLVMAFVSFPTAPVVLPEVEDGTEVADAPMAVLTLIVGRMAAAPGKPYELHWLKSVLESKQQEEMVLLPDGSQYWHSWLLTLGPQPQLPSFSMPSTHVWLFVEVRLVQLVQVT